MVATWLDDESSDCNEELSSSEGNEICFMAGSSEEQGLVQAMQTQAHTQAALQAQMEAQVWQVTPLLWRRPRKATPSEESSFVESP
ncbi:hypothetical protein Taro_046364 [Colocasia esculenta]|uniref:Uncharacterized protein n=1 Tax=Colocasia esculenta TaxID=4460 RepID=A0A843WYR0_COLES|nr:hypothetical protein [Colocasia esculenta]